MHRTLRQLALVCALAILPLAQALPARAVTVESTNYGGVNYITAIKGLDVGGTPYDISFISLDYYTDYSVLNLEYSLVTLPLPGLEHPIERCRDIPGDYRSDQRTARN